MFSDRTYPSSLPSLLQRKTGEVHSKEKHGEFWQEKK